MLKAQVVASPSVGLQLLDARIGNRKSCGLGARETYGKKWSDMRETFEDLVEVAVSHLDAIDGVMAELERWVPPPASQQVITLVPHPPVRYDAVALAWGQAWALPWFRQRQAFDGKPGMDVISLATVDGQMEYWVCAIDYKVSGFPYKFKGVCHDAVSPSAVSGGTGASASSGSGSGPLRIEMCTRPMQLLSSAEVFARMHRSAALPCSAQLFGVAWSCELSPEGGPCGVLVEPNSESEPVEDSRRDGAAEVLALPPTPVLFALEDSPPAPPPAAKKKTTQEEGQRKRQKRETPLPVENGLLGDRFFRDGMEGDDDADDEDGDDDDEEEKKNKMAEKQLHDRGLKNSKAALGKGGKKAEESKSKLDEVMFDGPGLVDGDTEMVGSINIALRLNALRESGLVLDLTHISMFSLFLRRYVQVEQIF